MKKRLTILGAGESGIGAAILGQKMGWKVFVSDSNQISKNHKNELLNYSITWEENGHTENKILQTDCVVKSPGIPNNTLIKKIQGTGINIISEVEFAFYYTKAKIIAITGSNGKTTTTFLLYNIFKNAGLKTEIVGNMGVSFARKVATTYPDFFIVEISSFQLEDIIEFSPHIAVLLNITPDHLNRYQNNLRLYANTKMKIAQNQNISDYFIYNFDDKTIRDLLKNKTIKSKILPFSQEKTFNEGAFIQENIIKTHLKKKTFTMDINKLGLKGKHNLYNSMAATIVANIELIPDEKIRNTLTCFNGVEHRLEKVLTIREVCYINDSKATNINATWYALDSIKTPIVWIAGGTDKGNDYKQIKGVVLEKVKAIICLTKDSKKLHEAFTSEISNIIDTQSMTEAIDLAYKFSDKGDTVLLSPACASFDLFENYEDRGKQFKNAVRKL